MLWLVLVVLLLGSRNDLRLSSRQKRFSALLLLWVVLLLLDDRPLAGLGLGPVVGLCLVRLSLKVENIVSDLLPRLLQWHCDCLSTEKSWV